LLRLFADKESNFLTTKLYCSLVLGFLASDQGINAMGNVVMKIRSALKEYINELTFLIRFQVTFPFPKPYVLLLTSPLPEVVSLGVFILIYMINTDERDAVPNILTEIGIDKLEELKVQHKDQKLHSFINTLLMKLVTKDN